MKAFAFVFFAFFLTSACAHIRDRSVEEIVPRYFLKIVDNPKARRFDLTLYSSDEKNICLSMSQWPSEGGWLDSGDQRAKLISGSFALPAERRTFGYSAGLSYVIAPGSSLRGHIPYSEFGEEEEIEKLTPRELIFSVSPNFCLDQSR